MIPALVNHLWQSTLFALGAGLLTLTLRKNAAGVRHGLWFAASVKFLVPFALLTAGGGMMVARLHLPVAPPPHSFAMIARMAQPMAMIPAPIVTAPAALPAAPRAVIAASHAAAIPFDPAPILLGVWGLGVALALLIWAVRWTRIRAALRAASPIDWPAPVPVLSSPALFEPGVVGVRRPVLVLPEGIAERLTHAELRAVIAHELCHVRRRDNLTGAIHMLVEALFWFHPLVWWLGARLIDERERACDEAVIRAGHDRDAYASGILETCRLYLKSPLVCVAGASGSVLTTRVELIMTAPPSSPLSPANKTLLLAAGVCAFAIPVAAGLLTSPAGRQVAARAEAMAARLAPVHLVSARSAGPPSAAPSAPQDSTPARTNAIAQSELSPTSAPSVATTDAPLPSSAQDLPAPHGEPTSLAAAPPTAQPAPPQATPVAPATNQAEAKKQSLSFVKAYAASTVRLGQIARWSEPVCVQVTGLAPDEAAQVQARVEEVAKAVGKGVLQPGCRANVQIVFSAQPQRVLDTVAARHEELLGYDYRDSRTLKTVTRPIQAWYATATVGGEAPIGGVMFPSEGGPNRSIPVQTEARVMDDSDVRLPVGCGDSRFSSCLKSVFDNVLVVVDLGRLRDQNVALTSDYVAMLALSQPRSLDGCNALPSVIDLYAPACPGRGAPNGLTPADAAYLTALYAADPEANKAAQQTDIARRMAKILVSANPTARAR